MTDRREFTTLFLSMFKIFHKKNDNAVKLDRIVGVGWEGLTEKITFEQRPKINDKQISGDEHCRQREQQV